MEKKELIEKAIRFLEEAARGTNEVTSRNNSRYSSTTITSKEAEDLYQERSGNHLVASSKQLNCQVGESSPDGSFRSASIAKDFRNAFPGLHGVPAGGSRLRQSIIGTSSRNNTTRGRLRTPFLKASYSWTQRFFCLAKPDDFKTADRDYAAYLDANGLGSKRVKFDDKFGDHNYLTSELTKAYPLLASQNGAIVLWRCSVGGHHCRPLEKLLLGKEGYNIPFLRDKFSTSSTIYVTPMLSPLIEGANTSAMSSSLNNDATAKAICSICKQNITFAEFADHLKKCSEKMLEADRAESEMAAANSENESALIENTNDKDKLCHLKEIFPNRSEGELKMSLSSTGDNLNDTIESLLFEPSINSSADKIPQVVPTSSSTPSTSCSSSLQNPQNTNISPGAIKSIGELKDHLKQTNRYREEIHISISRDELWREILLFYKKSITDLSRLGKDLVVSFGKDTGEENAVDAGAIKKEFFKESFSLVTERLFEGDLSQGYIPKRMGSSGKCVNYTVTGMLIGHAFLQSSLLFSRLQPWIFYYLQAPDDSEIIKCEITKFMIPRNAGTAIFLELIDELEKSSNQQELDAVLDKREFLERVNTSQWGITEVINIENKQLLIKELLFDELVRKREKQLLCLKDGLSKAGLLDWIIKYPDICKDILCCFEKPSSKLFLIDFLEKHYKSMSTESNEEKKSVMWLKNYVTEKPEERANQLLSFITSHDELPPWGLEKNIKIRFLSDDENDMFPRAETCFSTVFLPIVHSTKGGFFKYIDLAIDFEGVGFSAEE